MNNTKKSIQKSFMNLYTTKSYEKITVRELCVQTPIARTTFYSYYNNINDVKIEIENELIDGLLSVTERISQGDLSNMEFIAFLDEIQKYIQVHWDIFYAFLVHNPNYHFIEKWKDAIKNNFKRRYPQKQYIKNYTLVSDVIASATIDAYSYWMRSPDEVDTDDMKLLITKILDSTTKVL